MRDALDADVIVIGAGLAGSAVAARARRRGARVLVLAPGGIADGASGHRRAVARPRVRIDAAPWLELVAAGFADLAREVADLDGVVRPLGVLEVETDVRRLDARGAAAARLGLEGVRALGADDAAAVAGVPVGGGGLWFPGGLVVDAAALCRARLSAPGVEVVPARARSVETAEGAGVARTTDGTLAARRIVVAAGAAVATLLPAAAAAWGLRPVRGQVIEAGLPASTDAPRCVIARSGTIVPTAEASAVELGATYDEDDGDVRPRPEDDARILARRRVRTEVPMAALGLDRDPVRIVARWAGVRVRSRDRRPVAGTAPAFGGTGPGGPGAIGVVAGLGSLGAMLSGVLAEVALAEEGDRAVPSGAARLVDPSRFAGG